jgi:Protein of unknown function (DUF4038)
MSEERVWGSTRTNIFGQKPFLNDDPATPAVTPGNDPQDPAQYDYWDHLDYVLERVHAHGFRAAVVAMFVGWCGDGYKHRTKAKRITEGTCGKENYTQTLMTYHINGGASSSQIWHDSPWLDFNMAQTWSEYKDIYGRLQKDYLITPPKPCGQATLQASRPNG